MSDENMKAYIVGLIAIGCITFMIIFYSVKLNEPLNCGQYGSDMREYHDAEEQKLVDAIIDKNVLEECSVPIMFTDRETKREPTICAIENHIEYCYQTINENGIITSAQCQLYGGEK